MDAQGYRDPVYLHRYYAGQALIGLLANGRLDDFSSNEHDPVGAQQCATLAFAIADAMAEEAVRHSQY